MQTNNKNYIIFGPRVSEETRAGILQQFGGEEIPASFGPFASGAVHCELFPFLRDERKGKTQEEIEQRYKENLDKLQGGKVVVVESTGEQPQVSDSLERVSILSVGSLISKEIERVQSLTTGFADQVRRWEKPSFKIV